MHASRKGKHTMFASVRDGSRAPRHMHKSAAAVLPAMRVTVNHITQPAELLCNPAAGYVISVNSSGGKALNGSTSKRTRARK